ncbi:30S ribosomal protein S19 [Candidatus Woesearchaeota archaeon]|nr:30S ribosomal protein S19 [Candidatus Woesearchaeota archaeon]
MAKKEFNYRGKSTPELLTMSLAELANILAARPRRKIKRGFTAIEKKLYEAITKGKNGMRTHARSMIILPAMFGKTIKIYNGKEFIPVEIQEEMLGHYLGEFAMTTKRVQHSAPGIGASRSSASASVK